MAEGLRALILKRLTEYIRDRVNPHCAEVLDYDQSNYVDYGDTIYSEVTVEYVARDSDGEVSAAYWGYSGSFTALVDMLDREGN